MRIEKAKGIETSMVNQTKQALEASLKHLLLQKPLDKITISDLTKDCGISRMAFYYHFKDNKKRRKNQFSLLLDNFKVTP